MIDVSNPEKTYADIMKVPSFNELYDYCEKYNWWIMTVFVRRLMSLQTEEDLKIKKIFDERFWISHNN